MTVYMKTISPLIDNDSRTQGGKENIRFFRCNSVSARLDRPKTALLD